MSVWSSDVCSSDLLDEIERAVFVKKLEGAGATVTDAQARLDADPADLFALGVGDAGGRCFLDHLLMAALHRAVALAQMDGLALTVGQHLNLDMARVLQDFLHEIGRASCRVRVGQYVYI